MRQDAIQVNSIKTFYDRNTFSVILFVLYLVQVLRDFEERNSWEDFTSHRSDTEYLGHIRVHHVVEDLAITSGVLVSSGNIHDGSEDRYPLADGNVVNAIPGEHGRVVVADDIDVYSG